MIDEENSKEKAESSPTSESNQAPTKNKKEIEQEKTTEAASRPAKKREKKKIHHPLINIYISFSSNNTRITATLKNGDCIAWSTAGSSGFRGNRKVTPHAANETVSKFLEKMSKYSIRSARIIFKGISPSRDAIIRSLANAFSVDKLIDKTGYPHNGCRPPSRRAV